MNKYVEGLNINQFDHIPQISHYNHNYYKGFGNDLLYAESDDDSTTEWYLVNKSGNQSFKYIGLSHDSDNLLQQPPAIQP